MAGRMRHVRSARKSLWLQFAPADVTLTSSGSVNLSFSLNAAALALRPFTVVRSHFEVMVRSDQEAAVEQQQIGFGLAVVSDQAVAAGVASVPTPLTELGSSLWFVNRLIFGEESRLVDKALPARSVQIDSKAMRKVEVGMDIIVVAENGTIGGGAIISMGGRVLIKTN